MKAAFLASLVGAILATGPAVAGQMSCAEVAAVRLPDVSITESAPAGGGDSSHCRVAGVIGREINFVLLLPDEWNGRFFMGGGGGYVGSVVNSAQETVSRGYATVGTDTGHQDNVLSAKWALDDAERQVNFGHLAVHRTAEVSKALIRAYYGADPEYSYFQGCSRGGGQALMEAQRYPEDFDGIIAAAPAFDWTGFMAKMIQNVRPNYPDPDDTSKAVITAANLDLLETEVLRACDELDGVADGVMNDPRQCQFDVGSIAACPGEKAGDDCLTSAQRFAIESIYAPTVIGEEQVHPSWPFGGEGTGAGWKTWLGGPNGPVPNLHWGFGTEFFKYFIFGDPDWDYTEYDLANWEKDTRFVGSFLNSTDPDLSAFADRGGKLIVWHGWSDPALSANRTIEYYDEVEALDPELRDYFRMFLLPGVLHCAGGAGPDKVDWFDVIADWVENGNAPDRLVAAKTSGGRVERTRPLCPYPQFATYSGSGSTDEAASFVCTDPESR